MTLARRHAQVLFFVIVSIYKVSEVVDFFVIVIVIIFSFLRILKYTVKALGKMQHPNQNLIN